MKTRDTQKINFSLIKTDFTYNTLDKASKQLSMSINPAEEEVLRQATITAPEKQRSPTKGKGIFENIFFWKTKKQENSDATLSINDVYEFQEDEQALY